MGPRQVFLLVTLAWVLAAAVGDELPDEANTASPQEEEQDDGVGRFLRSNPTRKQKAPKLKTESAPQEAAKPETEQAKPPASPSEEENGVVHASAEAVAKWSGQKTLKARAVAVAERVGQGAYAVAIARGSKSNVTDTNVANHVRPPARHHNSRSDTQVYDTTLSDSLELLNHLIDLYKELEEITKRGPAGSNWKSDSGDRHENPVKSYGDYVRLNGERGHGGDNHRYRNGDDNGDYDGANVPYRRDAFSGRLPLAYDRYRYGDSNQDV